MSKFINTKYKDTINSITNNMVDKLDNPYYIYNNEKPTVCTYYPFNKNQTPLDDSTLLNYGTLGKDSAFKFDQIDNFILYGLDKANVDWQNGEFGMESSAIEGDAVIIPNTIIPVPNEYFTIEYDKKKVLFKVTNVTVDTIDNGNNAYKIEYKVDKPDNIPILDQIVNHYVLMVNNIGTDKKCIVRRKDYECIDKLDNILSQLKEFYKSLFYSKYLETFILDYNCTNFYDPYLVEFIKRNSILYSNEAFEYISVQHQLMTHKTFAIDYCKTFFKFIEEPNINGLKPSICAFGEYIDSPLTIFYSKLEKYFCLNYIFNDTMHINYAINTFDPEFIDRIFDNNKYDNDYKNIIIKYCNNEIINFDDVYLIEKINFIPSKELFYNIPILIFVLEQYIRKQFLNK